LQGIDPSLEEASRSLGHGPWRAFFRCVLPQLRPSIAAGALLSGLYAASDFGVVTLLRYDAFTRAIYVQYRSSFNRSQAAVLALLLIAFAVVLLLAERWVRGRRGAAYHRLGAGAGRQAKPIPLGRWRLPGLLYCAMVVAAGVVIPVAILAYWLLHGVSRGEDADELVAAAVGSLTASTLAAGAATLAALPVAILTVRYRGRIGAVVERISYLGFSLPGIVIALAFVFLGARYLTPLYQTMTLLVVAYVVRFLPQAVGGSRLSLLQISPRLEDAARNLGRSSLGAIGAITLPLARPGVLAGAALVFLTVMKELPLTLLLRPTGMETLATNLWSATTGGAYAKAAAPALLLILASALPTLLLERRGIRDGKSDAG
jgi:iron(III) transport system permease protein